MKESDVQMLIWVAFNNVLNIIAVNLRFSIIRFNQIELGGI
jgi:hypothetical protein